MGYEDTIPSTSYLASLFHLTFDKKGGLSSSAKDIIDYYQFKSSDFSAPYQRITSYFTERGSFAQHLVQSQKNYEEEPQSKDSLGIQWDEKFVSEKPLPLVAHTEGGHTPCDPLANNKILTQFLNGLTEQKILPEAHNPFTAHESETYSPLIHSYQTYSEEISHKKKHQDIIKPDALKELLRRVQKQIEASSSNKLKGTLYFNELANKLPRAPDERAKAILLRESHFIDPFSFQDILHHYSQKKFSHLKRYQSQFDPSDLDKTKNELGCFLAKESFNNYLKYLKGRLEKLEKPPQGAPYDSLSDEIVQGFSGVRNYPYQRHPEYLVYEYVNKILIRPAQIAKLEILNPNSHHHGTPEALAHPSKGALIEMIMGAGKTSVLTPLTALSKVNFDEISVLILPESLIPSMSTELAKRMKESFGRSVDVITINRTFIEDTNLSEKGQIFLQRLEKAKKEGSILVMSNKSLQSLFSYLTTGLRSLQTGFSLLANKGNLTVDEVDLILMLCLLISFQYQTQKYSTKTQQL